MTVVAALVDRGVVWMAADTLTNYAGTHVDGARKILRLPVEPWQGATEAEGSDPGGTALLAFSGDGALGALARRRLRLVAPRRGEALHEWADEVAVSLTEAAAAMTPPLTADGEPGETRLSGAALLAFRGRLFYLFTHQAVLVPSGIAALGSGCDVALGALTAGTRAGIDPGVLVELAVQAACQYVEGCKVGPEGPRVEHLRPS